MSEHFDLLVLGGGPAGMKAAAVAAGRGQRVALVDENRVPGGQIWRGLGSGSSAGVSHGKAFRKLWEELARSGARVLTGWRVIATITPKVLRLERESEAMDLAFSKLVLTTGARERFLPFPGWTLPGVVGAGGLQAFLKSGFDPRGRRLVMAGSGPLLFPVAALAKKKGAHLAGLYEQAPSTQLRGLLPALAGQPGKLVEGVGYMANIFPARLRTGCWIRRAEGAGKVESVVVTDGKRDWRVPCDLLAVGYHLVPNLELPLLFGCGIENGFVRVNEQMRSTVDDVYCAGELTGIGGLDKALAEGEIAGLAASGQLGGDERLQRKLSRQRRFAQALEAAYQLRPELRELAEGETIVCRCEDVRHRELAGYDNWREAKLSTRCGMGACQGRSCGPAVEFLYGWRRTSLRPPVSPATVANLAAPIESVSPESAPAHSAAGAAD